MCRKISAFSKDEIREMKELVERMHETIEVFSNKKLVRDINSAMVRFEKGEYLTEEQMYGKRGR